MFVIIRLIIFELGNMKVWLWLENCRASSKMTESVHIGKVQGKCSILQCFEKNSFWSDSQVLVSYWNVYLYASSPTPHGQTGQQACTATYSLHNGAEFKNQSMFCLVISAAQHCISPTSAILLSCKGDQVVAARFAPPVQSFVLIKNRNL